MAEPGSLTFPDGPRTELEDAIASLIAQSERVMRAQGRLRALLGATQAVVEESDLPLVLRRIVKAATELVDAEYGAIGVINPQRDALEQFIYAGLSQEDAAAIGHLPAGRGLLGALIMDPRPIRLHRMTDDPRSVGFPPHHPEMDSFLGVPVMVRNEVFGNLYLTNRRDGDFTEEDEQLVMALATTAGFAIDNARLLAEAETRTRWMTAAAELSAAILSTPTDAALDLLAGRVSDVANAMQLSVLLPDPHHDQLHVAIVRGEAETALQGEVVDPHTVFAGSVMDVAHARAAPTVQGGPSDPLLITRDGATGPAMAVPLRARARLWGLVCIARNPGDSPFSPAEIEGATDLASRASIAFELARAGEDTRRALLADDRRRIARDLHDHVIQQLFGTGLGLQALAGRLGPGDDSDSLGAAVDQLDDAISQIRTVIFALSHRDEGSVRHRLLDLVGELSSLTRRPPAVRFSGPVDHTLRDDLATDVVAVARELLSNSIRHAHADHISLDVAVMDGYVTVLVEDKGVGFSRDVRRSGLLNLEDRAMSRLGSFTVDSSDEGTSARWAAPIGTAPEEHKSKGAL